MTLPRPHLRFPTRLRRSFATAAIGTATAITMPAPAFALEPLPATFETFTVPPAPVHMPSGSPWPVYPILVSDRESRIAFQAPDPRHGNRQSAHVLRWSHSGKRSERWQNLDTGWHNPFPTGVIGHDLPQRAAWTPWSLAGIINDRVAGQRTEIAQLTLTRGQQPTPALTVRRFSYVDIVAMVGPGNFATPAPTLGTGSTQTETLCGGTWAVIEGGGKYQNWEDGESTACGALDGDQVGRFRSFVGKYWTIAAGFDRSWDGNVPVTTDLRAPEITGWRTSSRQRALAGPIKPDYSERALGQLQRDPRPFLDRGVAPVLWDVDQKPGRELEEDDAPPYRLRYAWVKPQTWMSWGFRMRWAANKRDVRVQARSGAGRRWTVLKDPCGRVTGGACVPGFADWTGQPAPASALGYGSNGVFVAGDRRITVWDKRTGRSWRRSLPWEARGQRTVFPTQPVATATRIALVSVPAADRERQPKLRLLSWPTEKRHAGWKRVR